MFIINYKQVMQTFFLNNKYILVGDGLTPPKMNGLGFKGLLLNY